MKAPERLNVLVSRARNCLIMIGNMATFMNSTQGKETWVPFFRLLKEQEYLHDGIRVKCEQHPDRTAILATPQDFDAKCPDGGCPEPCGTRLKCGIHVCERRCHNLSDHSKVVCSAKMDRVCDKQHPFKVRCGAPNERCPKCRQEEEDIRRRAKRDFELEKARLQREDAYKRELQEIKDELDHEKRLLKDEKEREDQKRSLEEQRSELAAVKETRKRQDSMKQNEEKRKQAEARSKAASGPNGNHNGPQVFEPGSPEEEWDDLKRTEFARSEEIDILMRDMIGLRDVKKAFLDIKSVVDTAIQQGVSTKDERFGCTLLGNPGTGEWPQIPSLSVFTYFTFPS